ncbi:unnamed protein product [Calicophoron daubneyi]|uniref:Uncharacterized protein n=1 Tax=Calicophoron daubneyi TaxID=300641 RepID=A0AAV2SWY8_CALDB
MFSPGTMFGEFLCSVKWCLINKALAAEALSVASEREQTATQDRATFVPKNASESPSRNIEKDEEAEEVHYEEKDGNKKELGSVGQLNTDNSDSARKLKTAKMSNCENVPRNSQARASILYGLLSGTENMRSACLRSQLLFMDSRTSPSLLTLDEPRNRRGGRRKPLRPVRCTSNSFKPTAPFSCLHKRSKPAPMSGRILHSFSCTENSVQSYEKARRCVEQNYHKFAMDRYGDRLCNGVPYPNTSLKTSELKTENPDSIRKDFWISDERQKRCGETAETCKRRSSFESLKKQADEPLDLSSQKDKLKEALSPKSTTTFSKRERIIRKFLLSQSFQKKSKPKQAVRRSIHNSLPPIMNGSSPNKPHALDEQLTNNSSCPRVDLTSSAALNDLGRGHNNDLQRNPSLSALLELLLTPACINAVMSAMVASHPASSSGRPAASHLNVGLPPQAVQPIRTSDLTAPLARELINNPTCFQSLSGQCGSVGDLSACEASVQTRRIRNFSRQTGPFEYDDFPSATVSTSKDETSYASILKRSQTKARHLGHPNSGLCSDTKKGIFYRSNLLASQQNNSSEKVISKSWPVQSAYRDSYEDELIHSSPSSKYNTDICPLQAITSFGASRHIKSVAYVPTARTSTDRPAISSPRFSYGDVDEGLTDRILNERVHSWLRHTVELAKFPKNSWSNGIHQMQFSPKHSLERQHAYINTLCSIVLHMTNQSVNTRLRKLEFVWHQLLVLFLEEYDFLEILCSLEKPMSTKQGHDRNLADYCSTSQLKNLEIQNDKSTQVVPATKQLKDLHELAGTLKLTKPMYHLIRLGLLQIGEMYTTKEFVELLSGIIDPHPAAQKAVENSGRHAANGGDRRLSNLAKLINGLQTIEKHSVENLLFSLCGESAESFLQNLLKTETL